MPVVLLSLQYHTIATAILTATCCLMQAAPAAAVESKTSKTLKEKVAPVTKRATMPRRAVKNKPAQVKQARPVDHLAFAPALASALGTVAPVGDFDGDGRGDLFARVPSGAQTLWQISAGGTQPLRTVNNSNAPVHDLAFGDFDGDGKTDVFRRHPNGIWYYSSAATGRWTRGINSRVSMAALRFGDFNGDGRTDVFHVSGDGYWKYSSGARESWRNLARLGGRVTDYLFGDLDGDGRTDVFRVAKGGQWQYSVGGLGNWKNLGRLGGSVNTLRLADFDGDGRADVFATDGRRWRYASAGTPPWRQLAGSNDPVSQLRFADLEGDGRADVITAVRSGTGTQWRYSDDGRMRWRDILFVGVAPVPDPEPDPLPDPVPDPDPEPDPQPDPGPGIGGGSSSGSSSGGSGGFSSSPIFPTTPAAGGAYSAVRSPARCQLGIQQIDSCAAASGYSTSRIAQMINAKQFSATSSCCQAIGEVQQRYGDVTCNIVKPEVIAQFNCAR